MKIIKINSTEIRVEDDTIIKMMEVISMDNDPQILIRSKRDVERLSRQIISTSECDRRERYLEAIANDDRLYLNSLYDSLSIKELLGLIMKKVQNHI